MFILPPAVERRRVQRFHLRGVVSRGSDTREAYLDEQTDPMYLDFSELSGYHEWIIEAEFEGGYTAAIVTCNWQGGACFIACGEYHTWPETEEKIESHECIIPCVKKWLSRVWQGQELYGVLRVGDAMECPHLEIFGRSA